MSQSLEELHKSTDSQTLLLENLIEEVYLQSPNDYAQIGVETMDLSTFLD